MLDTCPSTQLIESISILLIIYIFRCRQRCQQKNSSHKNVICAEYWRLMCWLKWQVWHHMIFNVWEDNEYSGTNSMAAKGYTFYGWLLELIYLGWALHFRYMAKGAKILILCQLGRIIPWTHWLNVPSVKESNKVDDGQCASLQRHCRYFAMPVMGHQLLPRYRVLSFLMSTGQKSF